MLLEEAIFLSISGKVFWWMLHCHLQMWYLSTVLKTPGISSIIVLQWEPLRENPRCLLILTLFSSLQNYSEDWNGKNCESKCGVRLLLPSPHSILLCACLSCWMLPVLWRKDISSWSVRGEEHINNFYKEGVKFSAYASSVNSGRWSW